MAKPKRVLWLVAEVSPECQTKQLLLEKHNHHVTWVCSLNELSQEITRQRAHVIIISEEGPSAMVCDHILGLSSLTEAKGSRWILTLKDHNPKVIKFATGSNFRDLIPIGLPSKQWIFRFLYATAAKAVNYPLPAGQITLGHRTDLKLPFRLIWLTDRTLRMETHIMPPQGARLTISGSFLKELNGYTATLLVEKVDHSQLSYRFSTAIEGTWYVENAPQERIAGLVGQLQAFSPMPRYRIFIAAKNFQVRKKLFQHLTPQQFEINSALQLKSLTQEPLFFSPDLVIVESIFCAEPYLEHFQKMQGKLSPSVPILILQSNANEDRSLFKDRPQRKLIFLNEISNDFLQIVKNHLPEDTMLATRQQKDAAYFDHDDRLAFGDIMITGKINKLHPMLTEIAFPYPVKDFALCQLLSPLLYKWLQKYPWIKLTQLNSTLEPQELPFIYSAPSFFVDLTVAEKRSLATNLGRFIAKVLGFTSGLLNEGNEDTLQEEENRPAPSHLPDPLSPSKQPLRKELSTPHIYSREDRMLTATKEEFIPPPRLAGSAYLSSAYKLITSQNARYFLIFILVTALFMALFMQVIPRLKPYYKPSGSTYVDQLNKFSNKNPSDE